MLEREKENLFQHGHRLYISGAVTDKLFNFLRVQKNVAKTVLIVKDFTRIFCTPEAFYTFVKKGGKVMVVQQTNLIAVCINPVSPEGYTLNSNELKQAMQEGLKIPVYDVKNL
jgi:hypothetical protein